MKQKIFLAVRADGGEAAGMGHLFKQAILLDELKKQLKGVQTFFFIKKDAQGMQWLRRRGIQPIVMPSGLAQKAEPSWMSKKLPKGSKGVFLLDILDVNSLYIRALRQKGGRVVTLENRSEGRRAADVSVNAIVEGPRNSAEHKKDHAAYRGGRYRVFHASYAKVRKAGKNKRSVLVTFGGGNDRGLTLFACKEILGKVPSARVTAVEGPAQRLKGLRGVRVARSPRSLADLLAKADCVLTAGGGTLYEAALMGVPAVAFAKRTHQRRNIGYFTRAGSAVSGGVLDRASLSRGADQVSRILRDRVLAERMARSGKKLVDGKGAARVARIIENELRAVQRGGRT